MLTIIFKAKYANIFYFHDDKSTKNNVVGCFVISFEIEDRYLCEEFSFEVCVSRHGFRLARIRNSVSAFSSESLSALIFSHFLNIYFIGCYKEEDVVGGISNQIYF